MDNHTRLVRQITHTIDDHAMFLPGDTVLVGVSGGPDSVALLHLLVELRPIYHLRLTVAHLNHGLRPEADEEARFVRRLAVELKLPFTSCDAHLNAGRGSIEERSREARYAWLERSADATGCRKIALGHQSEDNAEAVLMNLLRGSGVRGLAGIPPVRNGRIVRPLIRTRRDDLLQYLAEKETPFVWDASNTDTRFTRNRIRHRLLPLLQLDYNPNIIETLSRNAAACWLEDQWLRDVVAPLLKNAVMSCNADVLELSTDVLEGLHPAARRRTLREAVIGWRGDLRRIGVDHVEQMLSLLTDGKKGKRLNMPGFSVRRTAGRLRLHAEKQGGRPLEAQREKRTEGFTCVLRSMEGLPLTIDLPEACCRLTFKQTDRPRADEMACRDERVAWFDADQLTFPLTVRNFRPGDRITLGGPGGTQKFKKIFNAKRIPIEQRHRIPLIESAGRIIWAAGLRRSCWGTVSDKTSRVLRVSAV